MGVTADGLVLVQPDALLKTWRENYHQPAGHHSDGYTVLHGDQLRDRLSGSLNPVPRPPRAVCASNSATEWIAPYVRGGTHSFYADEPGARILQEALQLTHAAQGANVILHSRIVQHDIASLMQLMRPSQPLCSTVRRAHRGSRSCWKRLTRRSGNAGRAVSISEAQLGYTGKTQRSPPGSFGTSGCARRNSTSTCSNLARRDQANPHVSAGREEPRPAPKAKELSRCLSNPTFRA